jgi:hypothetical protein
MKIAVESMFDSSEFENAIMVFDRDDTLFFDIIDFMNNHKSVEYVSLGVDSDFVCITAGKYHTIRKIVCFPDIHHKSYSTNLNLPKKQMSILQNTKIYANRESFYFYGDSNGVIYQSHDITREMINQWCMEVANV